MQLATIALSGQEATLGSISFRVSDSQFNWKGAP